MLNIVRVFNAYIFAFLLPVLLLSKSPVFKGLDAEKMVHGADLIRWDENSESPSFFKFREGHQVPLNDFYFWSQKHFELNPNLGLILLSTEQDELDFTHLRYQQTYLGVPIEHSMLIIHVKNGKVHSFNGSYFTRLKPDTHSSLSEEQALSLALNHVNASVYKWQIPGENEQLKYRTGDPDASYAPTPELVFVCPKGKLAQSSLRLAFKLDIYSVTPLSRKLLYIDANTGEILLSIDQLHMADTPGTAVTGYSGQRNMISDSFNGGYRLRESGRGLGIETYDMNESTNYGNAVDFTDSDNFWNNVNADMDEYATDAHWGAEMTYDYFLNEHNRNSIDGNGMKLISYVHYDVNFGNAFWDGTAMTYGDGNAPFTALDICGHEISHGLTERTANLIYQDEFGALNESFSDIFGNAIERIARPGQYSWLVGEDLGNSIRDMQDPNSFGDPDTYNGPNWYTGTGDNGGVHFNSGVQNHWFYIMTEGESGTNGIGNTYSVTGLGLSDAGKIAFRNLTVYLTPVSEYEDARFYSIQAATDLFGPCSPEVETTTNAWYAVGVGDPYVNEVIAGFSANITTQCDAPVDIVFNNMSINGGSYFWDFGDGFTSTDYSPSHTYNNLGNYDVTLIADGGPCGLDTMELVDYIDLNTSNPCLVILDQTNNNVIQTGCSGLLYDSGGPNGTYQDMTSSIITIAPAGAGSVTLNFTEFAFELDWDSLYIYDGPSTSSPLIGGYTGYALPNGGTITSSGGAITLRQFTDQYVVDDGFALSWTCFIPNAPPSTDFYTTSEQNCRGLFQFFDNSLNGPTTWFWDFGDGNVSTAQNPIHSYTASGIYTVTLTSSNNFGSDVEMKTAFVTVTKPPAPNALDGVRCDPGVVTLNVPGSGDYYWYDVLSGGTPIASGGVYNTPSLSSTTSYFVEEHVQAPSEYVGPVDNTIGTGSSFNNADRNLFFDVYEDCTLKSVFVYATGTFNRTIEWRDATGTVIDSRTIMIPDGPSRINLDFALTSGIGYELGVSGQVDLYRNNAGPTYPYDLAGLVSITDSDAGTPGYYYFFYDWEIIPQDCISDRAEVQAIISPGIPPQITPSGTIEACIGTSITLYASGGSTYNWSNGMQSNSITVSSSGTYSVESSDGNGCVTTSTPVNVVFGNTLSTSISVAGDVELCPGESTTLSAMPAGAGYDYVWSNGETTSSITVEYEDAGDYFVEVSNGAACQSVSSDVSISQSIAPSINISSDGGESLCPGETLVLNAVSDGNDIVWSNGELGTTIVVDSPGEYAAEVTNSNGCTAQSNVLVIEDAVVPLLEITASGDLHLCAGESVNLSSGFGNGEVLWSNGSTNGQIVVENPGAYTYQYTDPVSGCNLTSASAVITLSSYGEPQISANGPTTFCEGESVQLIAPAGSNYLWSTGETTQNIVVDQAGQYELSMNFPDGCGGNSPQMNVVVNPLPLAGFTFSANLLEFSFTDNSSGATTWSWDFGDGFTSSNQNPDHIYAQGGFYEVTLTATNGSCSTSIAQGIEALEVGVSAELNSLGSVSVYPNPFSGKLYVNLSAVRSGNLKMTMKDVLGREVSKMYQAEIQAGTWELEWNNNQNLAEGTYFLEIMLGDETVVKKMILMN